MDSIKINPDQFAEAIEALLEEHYDKVDEILKKETKRVAKEFKRDTISDAVGHGWNNYSGSIATKKTADSRTAFAMTWYVKAPHYRLTHLLEYGHAKANQYGKYAGRTTAYGFLEARLKVAEKNYLEALWRGLHEIK